MEAFSHHTPIEEWIKEQAGFSLEELAEVNELSHKYKRRFGHTFIVYGDGLSPAEIVGQLRRRLRHDPYDELLVAGEHQNRISKGKLLGLLDLLAQDVEDVEEKVTPDGRQVDRPSRPRSPAPFAPGHDGEYLKARGRSAESSDDQAKKSA